jgi:GNAT superfamily N-acetyltransferase
MAYLALSDTPGFEDVLGESKSVLDKEAYLFGDTLRNGTPVTLRAARADDGPRILRAFKSLNRERVYTRFFGYKADVSNAEMERITGAGFYRDVVLLVTIGFGDNEEAIVGASYFSVETGPSARSAEIAFTVEEDYQGQGMASLLMRHIIRIARENKLTHLTADVLVRNLPMLQFFKHNGMPMTTLHKGDVVHVTLPLQSENADANRQAVHH